jgi:DNA-binding beta-propeller fold protein YncE
VKNYILFVSLSVLFSACVKDKPEQIVIAPVQLSSAKKVFVVNEGNYGSGNASVTLFDSEKNESVEDIYKTQNNSSPGDVAQSLSYLQNHFYLVVNNSKKVMVCDGQFKIAAQISGLTSPRYLLAITNQKAYISDLYANAISIIDLTTNTKTGSIYCPGKTERMLLVYNSVFVCNTDKEYVYVIDATIDRITDSVFVGLGASSLVLDKHDKIWVLSSGDAVNAGGRLSKIDPLSLHIELYFEFPKTESPWNLCLNKSKDTLFYLNAHIFRMPVFSANLPSEAFINRGTRNFYALGIHPHTSAVYASDALDYVQRSNIYIFDQSGKQLHLFKAGINANSFYFE